MHGEDVDTLTSLGVINVMVGASLDVKSFILPTSSDHGYKGPIVRWGPDFILINTQTGLQEIYGDSRINNLRKADIYSYFNDGKEAPSTQSTMEKGPASRKRRILSHAFSDPARRASDRFIVENVDRWCDLLGKTDGHRDQGWGEAKDMSRYCDWWAFDTAMDLAFGKSYRIVDLHPELRFLPAYIMSGFHGLVSVGHSPLMAYWKYIVRSGLNLLVGAAEYKKRAVYVSYAIKAMTERATRAEQEKGKSDKVVRKDYFYFLTQSTDSETKEGYSIPEIQAECTLLMNAGSNGPSVVLDAAFFYLTRYPAVYMRLVEEIRTVFNSVEEIVSGSKMNQCIYLRAVLEEALRLCPPVFGILPRQVMAGGQSIDGVFLPENTVVGTSAYCIHRNLEYFPEPSIFQPERWIVDDATGATEESVQIARSAFFAFSLGGSSCVGKQIAYQELSIALARVLFQYDFRLKAGDRTGAGDPSLEEGRRDPLEFQVEDVFAVLTNGPMVEFKARK
ncbi:MAG: hypothetical protein M1818_007469 [Claussenomyces sp. TS43310]|nr:MAG: hypothetical protein M1818_007469 [Claussenomyces sp. TS43310]